MNQKQLRRLRKIKCKKLHNVVSNNESGKLYYNYKKENVYFLQSFAKVSPSWICHNEREDFP